MDRGRILILGKSKETTYEIRSLLDNQRFELEIALSAEVGKSVLSTRHMHLIMVHTEMLSEPEREFVDFLKERRDLVPMAILGEQARQIGPKLALKSPFRCFDKPYVSDEVLSFIREL